MQSKFGKIKFLGVFLILFFFLLSNLAHAQVNTGIEFGAATGLSQKNPVLMAVEIIRVVLGFLGIIAVLLVIYSGFLWMTSGGDESKVQAAKNVLKNAAIGTIIILMSFSLATFAINFLKDAAGGGGSARKSKSGPTTIERGFGAIGSCTVRSVYPEPGQEEVARNTSIVLTFSKPVDDTTIFGAGGALDTTSVKIFYSNEHSDCTGTGACTSLVTNAVVTTTDHLTYVITPDAYLGSPSEYIWYTAYLTSNIKDAGGSNIFDDCRSDYFEWDFKVSNKIDLISPKILNKGVYPQPDNTQDTLMTTSAVQATGEVEVVSQPKAGILATVGAPSPFSGSPAMSIVSFNDHLSQSGNLRIGISNSGNTATLENFDSGVLLGSVNINSGVITFPGFFSLSLDNYPADNFADSNLWNIIVTPYQESDTLKVGDIIYSFVSGSPRANQIVSNANYITNIINTINGSVTPTSANPLVSASSIPGSPNKILITSRTAGVSGNSILLEGSDSSKFYFVSMHGGVDAGKNYDSAGGVPDKARNAAIQINFNEAVSPATLSGKASEMKNYIKVVCEEVGGVSCALTMPFTFNCGGDVCLDGKFKVSNSYRTVEFISNNLCGVNGCGENIYCLPGDSKLRVSVEAAALAGCGADACASKSPYNSCAGSPARCQNGAGDSYPQSASPLDGVADLANNSLDGNRDAKTFGPLSYYNENSPAASAGDSFEWSFFIKDIIDTTPPHINSIDPSNAQSDVSLSAPIEISFSEIMLSSSLNSGTNKVSNGKDNTTHRLINLRNLSDRPTGYWISKRGVDTSTPPDGAPEYTVGVIKHSLFSDASSYRAQVGSGVKDINQMCFNPSVGPGCTATAGNNSCCPAGGTLSPVPETSLVNGRCQ